MSAVPDPTVPKLRRLRQAAAGFAALAFVLIGPSPLSAAELVMFEEPGCAWCAAWNAEVGVVYDKTEEGRRAPLRRVDMTGPKPDDLQAVASVVFSPTFVLVENGTEIGRITGYPGEHFFWPMLEKLLAGLGTCRNERVQAEGQEC